MTGLMDKMGPIFFLDKVSYYIFLIQCIKLISVFRGCGFHGSMFFQHAHFVEQNAFAHGNYYAAKLLS